MLSTCSAWGLLRVRVYDTPVCRMYPSKAYHSVSVSVRVCVCVQRAKVRGYRTAGGASVHTSHGTENVRTNFNTVSRET